MNGLTVRWSLEAAAPGEEDELATYVETTSHARFSDMPGLRYKTWRMRPGEWFEGCYVFEHDAARTAFQDSFTESAAGSPGSRIVGAPPILIEPCDIVAVAEGAAGVASTARA